MCCISIIEDSVRIKEVRIISSRAYSGRYQPNLPRVKGKVQNLQKAVFFRYTQKTSGFKTSGFKTSGFKTSGLQNGRFTNRQVSKRPVSKRSKNPLKKGMCENLRKLSHHFASVSSTQTWLQQNLRI
jgi:hypothetical protein